MTELLSWAEAELLAQHHLAVLGNRWRHTQGVAARARYLAPAIPVDDRELLLMAAMLHDIGYGPDISETGFHPLDGARFLADHGWGARLCGLVAHHSAAVFEAEERDYLAELQQWKREDSAVVDALWTADMTTSPTGEAVSYEARLNEILGRYAADSIVGRAMSRAQPAIEAAIARTQQRLGEAGLGLFA